MAAAWPPGRLVTGEAAGGHRTHRLRRQAALALLLTLLAGCTADEPAWPAEGDVPPVEIVVERPVSPDGAGGLAGRAGAGLGAVPAADRPGEPLVADGFAALVPRLAVRDVAASLVFYRSLLGFELVGEPPGRAGDAGDLDDVRGFGEETAPGEAADRALLARGPVRIALEESAGEIGEAPSLATAGEEPAISLVLSVADAAALFDRLADRAPLVSALRDTEWGTREFAIADPDGHVVVLSEP